MEIKSGDVENAVQQLEKTLPQVGDVLVGKLITKSARIKGLLNKNSTKPVSMKRGGFSAYSLPESLYIRVVRFYSPDPEALVKSLVVKAIGVDGALSERRKLYRSSGSTYAHAFLDQFCSGFEVEIIGSKSLLTIVKIEATGYSLKQLESAAEDLRTGLKIRDGLDEYVTTLKSNIEESEAARDAINGEVEAAESEKANLINEVDRHGSQLTKLKETAILLASELEKVREEARIAQNTKQQVESELTQLNAKVGETRHELKDLIKDRRLISDEYSDFVLEGRKQSWWYAGLSIVPLCGAITALGFLLTAGWNFAKIAAATPIQAYSNLLQRAPYTIATVIAFTLMVKISHILLSKLIEIHGERLALAKLLVVARDTTYASAEDLDMDEDEIFKERMILKMQLLKDHLGMEDKSKNALNSLITEHPATSPKEVVEASGASMSGTRKI
ncbi:hypothetical protein [Xanthomonas vasicola]|uniref:Uncharacterized protein n=2 Tax=Xanthomonas vasicola TaxID=56459 RepID=A0ABD7SE33_XANVA|nr:hypothetical protein [Xanthomonas vasicola]AZR21948.1 hypothetical protein NX81_005825 [Xanthomonas vasicola]MDO6985043.1 hypothetical protein [Xanthomonas vasicola]TWQ39772.1 hypothetical protein FQJ96_09065 [Xanthomonas vasicola]TWQ54165.1 hypothetical protein FQJ94_13475 [Xanthomonas vasicola]TWQ56146.1 hypothetical protein FQK01_04455 [Xanthomonas vasicola]